MDDFDILWYLVRWPNKDPVAHMLPCLAMNHYGIVMKRSDDMYLHKILKKGLFKKRVMTYGPKA